VRVQSAGVGSDEGASSRFSSRKRDGCPKKQLVVMLLERGTTVPEEQLLNMTVDQALSTLGNTS
jgi:hypothetical protein